MLGIEISERAVPRILRRVPRSPGQTWKTFLSNHLGQVVSTDFFTVPTITLKVLLVFIVSEHSRREVLHFNVTDHPWQPGLPSRLSRPSPSTTLRAIRCGRGTAFMAATFGRVSLPLPIEEILTAPRSPGTIHTRSSSARSAASCLDHFIILNAGHLKQTLASYFSYYNGSRTHLGLDKQCPYTREVSRAGT